LLSLLVVIIIQTTKSPYMEEQQLYQGYQGIHLHKERVGLERKFKNILTELADARRQQIQHERFDTIADYLIRINELSEMKKKYTMLPFKIKYAKEIADIGIRNIQYSNVFIYIRQRIMNNLTSIYNDEITMYKTSQIKCQLLQIRIHNCNYDKIFKHDGLFYNLYIQEKEKDNTTYIKDTYLIVLDTLRVLKELEIIYCNANEVEDVGDDADDPRRFITISERGVKSGIRECELFIAKMFTHLAYHRKKMVALLPCLLGHSVDCNIATIIYDYCV